MLRRDVEPALRDSGLTGQDFAAFVKTPRKDGSADYGLRYEELITLCIRQIQRLQTRVRKLEETGMSKLSNAIGALRAGLVEAVNASGLPPCVVGMVLDQVRTQVRLLEAQEDAEAEEKKEEDNGALQSAG